MGSTAFAVTTRSRLKGVRFFPSMMIASWRIKRQLKHTPGCMRFASIVAGPREFWTITVWDSRDKMMEFMRSGAHEEIMWLFGKWLQSFWLMRWSPTPREQGRWEDGPLAAPRAERPSEVATGDEAETAPGEGERGDPEPARDNGQEVSQQHGALEAALESMPRLKASTGPRGAPRYDASPMVRRSHKAVAGGAAVVMRFKAPRWWQVLVAGRDVRRLGRTVQQDDDVLRWVSGFGGVRERFLLVVLRDEDACQRFLADPAHERHRERWGDAYWTMAWEAANEFGHWDGFRLRQARSRAAVSVPEHAQHLEG